MQFSHQYSLVSAAAGILLAVSSPVFAGNMDEPFEAKQHHLEDHEKEYVHGIPHVPTPEWTISSGGRLYDNWMAATDADDMEETHPSWPASNSKTGATTWRCKSCHGWDYKGVDGKYSGGSYMTGIGGVTHMQGSDPAKIAAVIRDDNHGYAQDMISDAEALRIGLFISRGLHDADAFIDRESGETQGSAARGAGYFQNVCAACHGYQGTQLDWGDAEEPAYVGTEANANPWEVLHKVRNGHPGVEMISGRPFGMEAAVDILTYIRTLPEK